jgi:hypothetical protein
MVAMSDSINDLLVDYHLVKQAMIERLPDSAKAVSIDIEMCDAIIRDAILNAKGAAVRISAAALRAYEAGQNHDQHKDDSHD